MAKKRRTYTPEFKAEAVKLLIEQGYSAEARAPIVEYIEVYYNSQRRHSSLGYDSPTDYERQNC